MSDVVAACPKCGQAVAVDDQFCEACGAPLTAAAEAGAAQTAVAATPLTPSCALVAGGQPKVPGPSVCRSTGFANPDWGLLRSWAVRLTQSY